MSRSGYDDYDIEHWDLIRWRGAVASAIRGKRGQAFLLEMFQALESLPEKKLIAGDLEKDGSVCALGAVGLARGLNMEEIDSHDYEQVASALNINEKIAREIAFENDEAWGGITPEERYTKMRAWIVSLILPVPIEDEPALSPKART
jgi:hypothetical protein